ncbi:hypothetical protein L1887_18498 [Cichorium endivia]|nr:hypothetical protein L1887_18498 [Cichorium endivia]
MIESETTQHQTFHRFFDGWLGELNTNLEQLVAAAQHHRDDGHIDDDSQLQSLIEKTVEHYDKYYKAKANGAKEDVLSMFSPTWLTKLEDACLWIAGWRPTTAIHLLYSKSGIQLEARLSDLIPVLSCGDLGDLTPNQIHRIDELQEKTIRKERAITEKMATLQESSADTPMVDLSNKESEMIRKKEDEGGGDIHPRVKSLLDKKKDDLEEVLHMGDGLRMETLKSVIEILTPLQAVYFLIAAAELHLRIHDWGQKGEAT